MSHWNCWSYKNSKLKCLEWSCFPPDLNNSHCQVKWPRALLLNWLFQKDVAVMPSGCQTIWNQIRPDILHGWKFLGLFLNSGFWGWLSIESQPQNAELVNYGRFSYLYTVCLKTIGHLSLKLWIFHRHTARFKIWVSNVQDFGNFELSSMHFAFFFIFWIKTVYTAYQLDVSKESEKKKNKFKRDKSSFILADEMPPPWVDGASQESKMGQLLRQQPGPGYIKGWSGSQQWLYTWWYADTPGWYLPWWNI